MANGSKAKQGGVLRINFAVDPGLHARIMDTAARQDRCRSRLIREALRSYLSNNEQMEQAVARRLALLTEGEAAQRAG